MRLRDLPLLSKLLLPNLVLLLAVGGLGTFVLVRDVAQGARAALDQELAQRALAARAHAQERQLYALEAATFAANVQGMSQALEDGDVQGAGRLLRSVRMLKADLAAVAAYDVRGRLVAREGDLGPAAPGALDRLLGGIRQGAPRASAAFLDTSYVLVLPVCGAGPDCPRSGAVLAALPSAGLLQDVPGQALALHDAAGRRLAGAALPRPPEVPQGQQARSRDGATELLHSRLALQGGGSAVLTTGLSGSGISQAVREDARRLALVVLAAVLGVIAVAGLLSQLLVRDVSRLLDVVRRIGRGDLEAREAAPGGDEIGELARGVNAMAEQLQADVVTLEARVAERTAEVERLLRQRSELFAALSHEFRTPLAVVRAEVSLLLDDPALRRRGDVKESLATVAESSGQVLALVNDVLDLARGEAGKLDLRPSTTTVQELVAPVVRTLRGLAAAADVAVQVQVGCPEQRLVVDVQRVRQVLLNLVSNALRYGGDHVLLRVHAEAGVLVVEVEDDGRGIPAEQAERVYEPFARVPGQRTRDGAASSGLGLSLSRALAEACGGSLAHTSRPGCTTFRLRLPLSEDEALAAEPVQRLEPARDA